MAVFDSVLIANRGEIASRIIRTLRRLGIRAVAVYSDADADARHVYEADAAYRLGPAAPHASYLDIDRVLTAARAMKVQALHPGYGFLSENAAFAMACTEMGIAFIGPPPAAIEAMGDKIRAKDTVAARGVPVVPGVSCAGIDDERQLIDHALTVGFPMLLKPSAGGGGKGMRLVTRADDLLDAIQGAQREARRAFGDDTLLIERFIERPRHVEVQVLADQHGNVVHLGERECSLQRRHQKIIEEAPSPLLSQEHRIALGEIAAEAARACEYVNAGTVEFIVSAARPSEPYFMEMNTRLQVEHPVTEMVTGLDLVEMQLRVAAGEPLGFSQGDVTINGWAMEARVYAEDPRHSFLPTGGRILYLHEPTELTGVRIDSALAAGTEVGSTYDPMLAKVIAWGPDRECARRRLRAALRQTTTLGLTTNVAFLGALLDDGAVVAGDLHTGLAEEFSSSLEQEEPPDWVSVAAALLERVGEPADQATTGWGRSDGWRLGRTAWLTWRGKIDSCERTVRLQDDGGTFRVDTGDDGWRRARVRVDGSLAYLELGDVLHVFRFARSDRTTYIGSEGTAWRVDPVVSDESSGSSWQPIEGNLISPMPGTVIAVRVGPGGRVVRGQPIVVVEAMKMEYTLVSPSDGELIELLAAEGQFVEMGAVLATIKPDGDSGPLRSEGTS